MKSAECKLSRWTLYPKTQKSDNVIFEMMPPQALEQTLWAHQYNFTTKTDLVDLLGPCSICQPTKSTSVQILKDFYYFEFEVQFTFIFLLLVFFKNK